MQGIRIVIYATVPDSVDVLPIKTAVRRAIQSASRTYQVKDPMREALEGIADGDICSTSEYHNGGDIDLE